MTTDETLEQLIERVDKIIDYRKNHKWWSISSYGDSIYIRYVTEGQHEDWTLWSGSAPSIKGALGLLLEELAKPQQKN